MLPLDEGEEGLVFSWPWPFFSPPPLFVFPFVSPSLEEGADTVEERARELVAGKRCCCPLLLLLPPPKKPPQEEVKARSRNDEFPAAPPTPLLLLFLTPTASSRTERLPAERRRCACWVLFLRERGGKKV